MVCVCIVHMHVWCSWVCSVCLYNYSCCMCLPHLFENVVAIGPATGQQFPGYCSGNWPCESQRPVRCMVAHGVILKVTVG